MQRGERTSASLPRTVPAAAREERDRNASPDDLWARLRAADDRMAHLHEQLMRERAARAEDQASVRLASIGEANRRMDTFLAVAGHELCTPLTSATIIIQHMRHRFAEQVAQQAASPEAVAAGQEAGYRQSPRMQLASLDRPPA